MLQANLATLLTGIANSNPIRLPIPLTHYIVILAHPQGDFIPESTLGETNRDCVVNDIAGGVHLFPVRRVLAFEVGGKCWDASREIARDVLHQALDTYECGAIPSEIIEFCEDILGVHHVRSCELEAAA